MKVYKHLAAAVAAVGLVGAGAALHAGPGSSSTSVHSGLPLDGSLADTAERVFDSVVTISVSGDRELDFDASTFDPFGGNAQQGRRVTAQGSGVIVTAGGRILTNAHVVNGFDDIKVTLSDGTEHEAKVIGKDTKVDLAVIQLKGSVPTLKPITWGDASQLRLGDIVLAVGDGLGVGKSVSMGIVSAKGRGGMNIEEYEDFIQTDAAINPGNSGGALVNLRGELVGINTAIASRSGGSQGIGFAIPSTMARPIMEMLVKDGKVTRGFLGIVMETVNRQIAEQHKLGATTGVAVAKVQPGTPAAQAKLVEGDVIVGVDGQPIRTSEGLKTTIAMIKPGTTVALDVVHRDGRHGDFKVKLGEAKDQPEEQEAGQSGQTDDMLRQMQRQGWNCRRTQNGVQCEQHR